jgi:hypothetical protein
VDGVVSRDVGGDDHAGSAAFTETNLMKPFITPEVSAQGKKLLKFQCEGISIRELRSMVLNKNIVCCSIPPGSVSVAGQCSDEGFAPQFALSTCRREKII